MTFVNILYKHHLLLLVVMLINVTAYTQVKQPAIVHIGTPQDTTTGSKKEMLEYTSGIEENRVNRDTTYLQIGGALRFNYVRTNYEQGTAPLGTSLRNDFTMDTWRLNINAESKGLLMSFEYRFYPTFNTHFLHHGWFGYNITKHTQVQLGVSQVPFGNLKYASHSWWFQTPYYVGLEDDYDMGIKVRHKSDRWEAAVAYYLLAEPRGTSDPTYGPYSAARYSYDIVPVPGNNNVERNQFNLRGMYNFAGTRIGASLQRGQVINLATNHIGSHTAGAIHLDGNYGRFNVKAEYLKYGYNDLRNDAGQQLDVVQMGAYGFGSYDVAAAASMYVAGVSYSLPVKLGPVSNITFYNDYTYTDKKGSRTYGGEKFSFVNTEQNVLGALLSAGKIYTYIDWAAGKNHPWLTEYFGGQALGVGHGIDPSKPVSSTNKPNTDPRWNSRFNINIGYYF